MSKIFLGKNMTKFFDFYKNGNFVVKFLFLGVALIMALLWVLGSLTKIDRLVMFMVGTIIGGTLINVFLYDYIVDAINYISKLF